MSRTASYTVADDIVQEKVTAAFLNFRSGLYERLLEELSGLDKQASKTLQIIVGALIEGKFEQKELSAALTVSRTTINRWANGQNIPRSPAYREWVATKLIEFLRHKLSSSRDALSMTSSNRPSGRNRKVRAK